MTSVIDTGNYPPASTASLTQTTKKFPSCPQPFTDKLINAATGEAIEHSTSNQSNIEVANNPFSILKWDELSPLEQDFFNANRLNDKLNFRILPSRREENTYEVCAVIRRTYEAGKPLELLKWLQHFAEKYEVFNFILEDSNKALTYRLNRADGNILPVIIEGHRVVDDALTDQILADFRHESIDNGNQNRALNDINMQARHMSAARTIGSKRDQASALFEYSEFAECPNTREFAGWLHGALGDRHGEDPLEFEREQRDPIKQIHQPEQGCPRETFSYRNLPDHLDADSLAVATRGRMTNSSNFLNLENGKQLLFSMGNRENVKGAFIDLAWKTDHEIGDMKGLD